MSDSGAGPKDSITQVADESFIRERPLEIERGAVLAGRYQVEEVIGKGGSGVVLRVFDRTVQNVVALKVLKAELARDAKWDKRFSRELRLGRPIQHPNVCRIFDIGEADGHRFLTMELASGGSLRDELKRQPALERPIEDRLRDAQAAIEGLAAIHGSGVVHRDFKPDNLLRMADGRLVISDFGLATDAATAPGVTVMIGTPHYMAPEVLAGEPATTRSDVWALGVVLHEIFFGRRPERKEVSFDGSGRSPLRPATLLEVEALELCRRCLVETPGERPSDAREISRLFADMLLTRKRHLRRPWVGAVWIALPLSAAIALALGWRLRTGGAHSTARARAPERVLAISGIPADWSRSSKQIARYSGRVHCLSAVDDHTVRIVWGVPHRAVDVDIATGRQKPARLVPESYQLSCPDVSPKTGQVVYTARNASGALEIRLSGREDGSDAAVVTSGRDPHWLGAYPSFVYDVDDSHIAIFSVPTMELSLLPEAAGDDIIEIGDAAVNPAGDLVAITGYDQYADSWIGLIRPQTHAWAAKYPVPMGSRIAFGGSDEILVAGSSFQKEMSVAAMNVKTGELRRLGGLPGMDITHTVATSHRLVFVARRLSTDLWSYASGRRERLTTDGDVLTAAISREGALLLSRRAPDGTLRIWRKYPDGSERPLTSGPKDTTPGFSPDGTKWAYADYPKGTIRICQLGKSCADVFKDSDLPVYPTFAPDGRRFAVLTQSGHPQLKLVGIDGRILVAWDALPVCGAVWSSNERVWSVESAHGVYYWVEHDASTGEPTAGRVRFAADEPEDSAVTDCRAQGAGPESPLFRPIQTEAEELSAVHSVAYQVEPH